MSVVGYQFFGDVVDVDVGVVQIVFFGQFDVGFGLVCEVCCVYVIGIVVDGEEVVIVLVYGFFREWLQFVGYVYCWFLCVWVMWVEVCFVSLCGVCY